MGTRSIRLTPGVLLVTSRALLGFWYSCVDIIQWMGCTLSWYQFRKIPLGSILGVGCDRSSTNSIDLSLHCPPTGASERGF